jgi:Fe-S cluster biogenesis protein NfuA
MDQTVTERVQAILRRLGPSLSVDGGGVELDRVDGETAYIRLTGACVGCPGRDITLRYGIESAVTEEIPEISSVVTVEEESEG